MHYSSRLLENAVNEFSKLPGIGEKTALRLVLHLLAQNTEDVGKFSESLTTLKREIRYCKNCGNISDQEICEICASPKRNRELVCIVEDTRDVMAIENTNQYNGLYHVLGGLISPMDGVGPSDLNIEQLVSRVATGEIKEIVLALNATMEGDTTIFYINKKIKDYPLVISVIARGISFGGEIEYTDELTLARSIATRVPYSG